MYSYNINKNLSAKKAVPKVYVTVQLLHDDILTFRNRVESNDIAGKYVCYFSSKGITSKYVSSFVHREGCSKTFRAKINRSTYTARNGFEKQILDFIKENPNVTFVGPAYHESQRGSWKDHITDTQLYVSGAIEDIDVIPEDTVRREILEEIGVEINYIEEIDRNNGDIWFHVII